MTTEERIKALDIGSPVWIYDNNRRRYVKGRLDEAHCWEPLYVIGQNRINWLVGHKPYRGETVSKWNIRGRIPKKGPLPRGYALSLSQVRDSLWVNAHRHHIAARVERLYDTEMLREIARLVGYKDETD